jgi:hypothetical protein
MLAGMLAVPVPFAARADEAAAEREAQARFDEGVTRVKAGNLEGARISFTQAYAVLHKPTILWNLALADEKTGHLLDALGHFKEFARGLQSGDDRASAERHIGAITALTAHLDVTAPAGTQVVVDGASVGMAPLGDTVDVMPGRHHLEVHTTQGTKEADAEVGLGQLVHVSLMLPAEPAAVAAGPLGAPNLHDSVSPPVATASREGAGTEEAERNGPSTPRVIAVLLLGTGAVASVGLGAYFAVQSRNDRDVADGFRSKYPSSSYCLQMSSDPCTQWNDAVQAQGRDATRSYVFYVAGGVLAAGALATWFFWPEGSKDPKLALTPAVGPQGAGLGAAGRF